MGLRAGWVRAAGKRCLWVTTAGADAEAYTPEGIHQHTFEAFVPVMRQTAQFCGMTWLDPILVLGVQGMEPAQLAARGARYRARLEALLAEGTKAGEVGSDA